MEKIINYLIGSFNFKLNYPYSFIFGKIIDNKLFPMGGVADIFIYELVKTYYIGLPLFFQNSMLVSNIHSDHERFQTELINIILEHYIK